MLKSEEGTANTAYSRAEGLAWLAGGRVPGLDGLRALSIALVLFHHGAETAGSPFPAALRERYYYGALGVDIFFVISGFLITLLLLREEGRSGTVSLRGFYTRRAFRILPAYFAYLGFVFLLTRLGAVRLRWIDWVAAMTYTMNFLPHQWSRWVVGHMWSLSIEEHFYLLWPPALVLLGSRRARLVLLVIFPLAVASRYASWTVLRHWIDLNYAFITPNRMDSIAAGCLLAYLVCDRRVWPWLEGLARWGTIVFLAAILILAVSSRARRFSDMYDITLGRTIESSAIALCILAVVSSPRSVVGRLLETRPMVVVGVLSYSLYLWQQPFLNPRGELWICRWPQNLLLATTAAIASHLVVERPFLRLKDRIGPRAARPAPGTATEGPPQIEHSGLTAAAVDHGGAVRDDPGSAEWDSQLQGAVCHPRESFDGDADREVDSGVSDDHDGRSGETGHRERRHDALANSRATDNPCSGILLEINP